MNYENFMNLAAEAGFTDLQAQFMWECLRVVFNVQSRRISAIEAEFGDLK